MMSLGSSLATQHTENITSINKDDNSSETNCKVFFIDNKVKGVDIISFVTIAAIFVLAGFLLAFAGEYLILLN